MSATHRFFRHRPYLAFAALIGALVGAFTPNPAHLPRLLIAWNVAAWTYLLPMWWLMTSASQAKVKRIAEEEDRSAVAVLAILSVAAVTSLVAIFVELNQVSALPQFERIARYVLTALTLAGSWCLVGTLFTFHYAHMFYRAPHDKRPLAFPGECAQPDYWDFLYVAFTLAVAVQTADVQATNTAMRKAMLAQSVLSFFFNAAILGLSINIAAALVGA
jgi:uncharacterized membrane protein